MWVMKAMYAASSLVHWTLLLGNGWMRSALRESTVSRSSQDDADRWHTPGHQSQMSRF